MRSRSAVALILALVVAVAGCGDSATDGAGARAATEGTTPATTIPESTSGRAREGDEEGQKKAENPDRAKDKEPAEKIEKPPEKRKDGAQPKAVREAIERVKRLQQQASEPLTQEDLEKIAARAQGQAERLVDPPPGKTVIDVLREIEREAAAGIP